MIKLSELYRRDKISRSVKKFYKQYGAKRKVPVYECGIKIGWLLMDRRSIGETY